MLGRKLLFLTVIVFILLSANVRSVHAVTTPTFPSCVNPQGTQKVSYSQGTHGVAGDTNSYAGSDSVYTLSGTTLLQCLCASTGAGIQTNWWKISDLSEVDKQILIQQGWVLVPDGSSWGLSEGAYLAQNINFSCNSTSTTNSSTGDGRSDGLSDGRSDGLGSIVQSATGNAGNLASTGNILFVLSILSAGLFMTLFGLWLRKNTN